MYHHHHKSKKSIFKLITKFICVLMSFLPLRMVQIQYIYIGCKTQSTKRARTQTKISISNKWNILMLCVQGSICIFCCFGVRVHNIDIHIWTILQNVRKWISSKSVYWLMIHFSSFFIYIDTYIHVRHSYWIYTSRQFIYFYSFNMRYIISARAEITCLIRILVAIYEHWFILSLYVCC